MSHAGTEIKADPNLTPLLDLVLQLLMFFVITANFAVKQVSEGIQLPVMASARPLDQGELDILYLNLTRDAVLEVVGRDPMKDEAKIKNFLNSTFGDAKRLAGSAEQVKTIIVIRADQNVPYKHVYKLMHWCKEAGFRKFQMRAKNRPN